MPRRLSDHEKDQRGSHAARKNVPKLAPTGPKMPRFGELLGDRQAGRDATAWWKSVVPELERAGVLARVDDTILIDAATCVARIRMCERQLGSDLVVDGPRGTKVRNPVSLQLASYRQSLKTYVRELGLSPNARQGLDLPARAVGLTPSDKFAILAECDERGINCTLYDLAGDDWDLAGIVPDDLCDKYRRTR
jgi:P27 family predicted phage terminase small subunit